MVEVEVVMVAVVGVDDVGHMGVRLGVRGCWPRSRSLCWPSSVSMELAFRVFDVVAVTGGRGVGRPSGRRRCRWCGLRWCSTLWARLLAEGWVVACPARAPCPASPYRLRRSVFRHCVGAGCGVVGVLPACCRGRCRWSWLLVCSMTWAWMLAEDWVAASPVRGRGWCRWCGLFLCSRLWLCSMAEV